MDENQITDRPERVRPETGITDAPPEHGVPTSPVPRRKMRWWMPVAVLVLMGGAIGFFLSPAAGQFDQAIAHPGDQGGLSGDHAASGPVVRILHWAALGGPDCC